MTGPVQFEVAFSGRDMCAFITRPLGSIVVRTTYGVVVPVANNLSLESRLANGAFEGSIFAVCLLMRY
jgi:hypothetical protein